MAPPPSSPQQDLAAGLSWPLRGARLLLGHRELWGWVVAPALITSTLLLISTGLVLRYTPALLAWLWPLPPDAGGLIPVLWWSVAVVLMAALATVTVLGTYFASGLIAVPFLDRLSEHVEVLQNGQGQEVSSWATFFGDVGLSLLHTTLALLLWAVCMALLLAVGLIPVVGPPAELVLSLVTSALLVAREMMDGPMSRRRLGFLHKLKVVADNRWTALGFGLLVAALLWVPLLNFVLLPVAVVGGTLMFLDLEDRGLVPPAHEV